MRFKDGKFRIMQIADVQDAQFTSRDYLNFIGAALDREKPDLAVFTGDQVKSYSPALKIGDRNENVAKTIRNIVAPLVKRNVPFIFTFGNHDALDRDDRARQTAVYESFTQCKNGQLIYRYNSTDVTALPVFGEDGKIRFCVYMIDNCKKDSASSNGVTEEQMDALDEADEVVTDAADGNKVPAMIFQHIPVYEMYELLEEVEESAPGAVKGNSTHRGSWYRITPEMEERHEFMLESVAALKQNGQFERWVKLGNIKGAFFGHDHNNSFTGEYRGIRLGYCPGSGFGAYGPGYDRAVRIFDINEFNGSFNTYTVSYRDIMGEKVENRLNFEIMNRLPSSFDAAKPMIYKASAVLGTTVAASIGIAVIKNGKSKK
jgi:predicted MPP superfamily phosphohydrolase